MDMFGENEGPVLENLNGQMRCGVFTNDRGEVVFVHDRELPGDIQWVEYDPEKQDFMFIHENGQSQQSGISLSRKTQDNLLKASEIIAVQLKDKQIVSQIKLSLVIHD